MNPDKLEVLLDTETIAARIQEMADEIRGDLGDVPITAICVLKGSFVFTADLVRAMPDANVSCAFLGVSSYEGTQSTGAVQITHDLRHPIEGQHCLIIEDIIDTGLTLRYLKETLALRNPATLKVVTLLDKPSRRKVPMQADYVGFEIPDAFVVGFGLDLDQRYRNLPYVGVFR